MAATGNFTAHAYDAFNVTSALAPIVGGTLCIGLVLALLFWRNKLIKLLLGYLVLGVGYVLFIALYGVAKSLPMILTALKDALLAVFTVTGTLALSIPKTNIIIFILFSPLAYWIGDKLQKYVDT